MGPTSDQQKGWIDRGLRRIDSLGFFLHDLQTLSELDEGKLAPLAAEVNIDTMLKELVEEHQDLAEQKQQRLQLQLNGEMPSVRGVARLLREAVANYLTNALKYTPSGGSISVSASYSDGAVQIEVEDDGVGISPEDQERLFKEFMRVGHPHSEMAHSQGSGLGLSIAKRVVDAHGGRVWCRSELDRGSTFGMSLPLTGPE
jgi:signal transduction histidine kinase